VQTVTPIVKETGRNFTRGAIAPVIKSVEMINSKKGQKRAKELKAQTYVECTSKDPASVNNVFVEAIRVVLEREKKMKQRDKKKWKDEMQKEERMKKLAEKKGLLKPPEKS